MIDTNNHLTTTDSMQSTKIRSLLMLTACQRQKQHANDAMSCPAAIYRSQRIFLLTYNNKQQHNSLFTA